MNTINVNTCININGAVIDMADVDSFGAFDSVASKQMTTPDSARVIKFFHRHKTEYDWVSFDTAQKVWSVMQQLFAFVAVTKIEPKAEDVEPKIDENSGTNNLE